MRRSRASASTRFMWLFLMGDLFLAPLHGVPMHASSLQAMGRSSGSWFETSGLSTRAVFVLVCSVRAGVGTALFPRLSR